MAQRFTHDQPRTESPRLKDIPAPTDAERSVRGRRDRDDDGRFAPGNRAAVDRGIKSTIVRSLGLPSEDPAAREAVRQALQLYRVTLRELPSDGAAVRQLVAAQARHAALATAYANAAGAAGLTSDAGMQYAEAARRHDQAAQRLSVTAYDRSVRESHAKAKAAGPLDLGTALDDDA